MVGDIQLIRRVDGDALHRLLANRCDVNDSATGWILRTRMVHRRLTRKPERVDVAGQRDAHAVREPARRLLLPDRRCSAKRLNKEPHVLRELSRDRAIFDVVVIWPHVAVRVQQAAEKLKTLLYGRELVDGGHELLVRAAAHQFQPTEGIGYGVGAAGDAATYAVVDAASGRDQ